MLTDHFPQQHGSAHLGAHSCMAGFVKAAQRSLSDCLQLVARVTPRVSFTKVHHLCSIRIAYSSSSMAKRCLCCPQRSYLMRGV